MLGTLQLPPADRVEVPGRLVSPCMRLRRWLKSQPTTGRDCSIRQMTSRSSSAFLSVILTYPS